MSFFNKFFQVKIHLILLLIVLLTFSCKNVNKGIQNKTNNEENKLKDQFANISDSISKIGATYTYREIIPFVENNIDNFRDNKSYYHKLKLELAEYYFLDYLIDRIDTSYNRSVSLLNDVLNYNEDNPSFLYSCYTDTTRLNSFLIEWEMVENSSAEQESLLIKFLIEKLEKK